MTRVVASTKASRATSATRAGALGIGLYHPGTATLAGVGHALRESARICLPRPPSVPAWDFLSFALAVFGSDRFLLRSVTPDGWTREIALDLELVDPIPWIAHSERINSMLRFLTGDVWNVDFKQGGAKPPSWHPKFTDRDCVCLFSGGMDSFIGAADLATAGRQPLLVSQASPKEGPVQEYLARKLGLAGNRFDGRVIERRAPPYEASSRSRSILFLAYGVVAASALGAEANAVELFLPENGLISINPPFYRRRLGSLSTRTTHPHFIKELHSLLTKLGLNIELVNPYKGHTKGEMLAGCGNNVARQFAHYAYSCGKGKRLNQHCGRCVPCLIRRAAFYHAKLKDKTDYWADTLEDHAANDDVFAARLAVAQLGSRDIQRWTSESGPLPYEKTERKILVEVVQRGLNELQAFLAAVQWR